MNIYYRVAGCQDSKLGLDPIAIVCFWFTEQESVLDKRFHKD